MLLEELDERAKLRAAARSTYTPSPEATAYLEAVARRRAEKRANRPPRKKCQKLRYHHGDLEREALRVGVEVVRLLGPQALTMRGLARRLGVSATALVYYFGHVGGLRAAVAQAIDTTHEKAAFGRGVSAAVAGNFRPEHARERLEEVGTDWIRHAQEHPNEFRLQAGEGWIGPSTGRSGRGGAFPTPAPERRLRVASTRLMRLSRVTDEAVGREGLSILFAAAARGLAESTFEGVPVEVAERAYGHLVRLAFPMQRTTYT